MDSNEGALPCVRLCIKRGSAFFIDAALLGVLFFILRPGDMIGLGCTWIYFAGLEASWLKATVGKRCLGLSVSSKSGCRASFFKTSTRFFGKYASAFIFYASYLFIFWTKRRQALHDLISGCVVGVTKADQDALFLQKN